LILAANAPISFASFCLLTILWCGISFAPLEMSRTISRLVIRNVVEMKAIATKAMTFERSKLLFNRR
jgi:hypothetical protein